MLWIKIFIDPHERHHIHLARILNLVRVARRDFDDFEFLARNIICHDILAPDLSQTDDARPSNNEEFLML